MSDRTTAALGVWRSRHSRSAGDRAYVAYSLLLGALLIGAPVGRALWLALTTATVTETLTGAVAAPLSCLSVLAVFSAALIFGTRLGPAALPAVLVHALARSDLPRWIVYRRRLITAGLTVVTISCAAPALVVGSFAARGQADAPAVVLAAVDGVLIGVVTTALWLVGQAFPRVASCIALGAVVAGTAAALSPSFWTIGRTELSAGEIIPGRDTAVTSALLVAATICAATVGVVLERLDVDVLDQQARQRDLAVAHTFSLDVAASASALRALPAFGRTLRAVPRSKRLVVAFLWCDAVSSMRTPSRLGIGLATLCLAGLALASALVNPDARTCLGALSGLLAYVGLGPLTDGVRHAGHAAADFALYGISDQRLMLFRSTFPLVVGTVVIACVGSGASLALMADELVNVTLGGIAIAVVALGSRVSDAVRGPSPTFLLTPAPSAMGDPMPALRILWALDGPVFATLGGAAAATIGCSWAPVCAVAGLVCVVGVVRWFRRD